MARAGARTAVVDIDGAAARRTCRQIKQAGGWAMAIEADVTQASSVDTMIQAVQTQLGAPAILVNNVGGTQSVAPIAESDPDAWLADLHLNLGSAFLCSRAVLPGMIERQRGRIINIASNGAVGPWPLLSAYAASKAGVVSLTQSLAREVRAQGISVFALHPGHVHTRLVEQLSRQLARYRQSEGGHLQLSAPDAAARLCVYLAGGGADHLSGHFFPDATDTPQRVFWRWIGYLGLLRREAISLRTTRQVVTAALAPFPSPTAGPGRRIVDVLRGLFAALLVLTVQLNFKPAALPLV
ncbi:MAG: SDR family NAD(P)-dependent oxidoreductase [Chloroflexi bacterium]|nr:SDR family NAD(P)-dependent oxidoreductase [Chloroflexota bacterium]